MMQYTRLTLDQLSALEKEFIDFLVVNGIAADDWENLRTDDPEKANAIIDQFSDVVWEGSLRKASYIEMHLVDSIYCFKCGNDEIQLIKVNKGNVASLNSTDNSKIDKDSLKLFHTQKAYSEKREHEMFKLLKQGAELSSGELFEKLKRLI